MKIGTVNVVEFANNTLLGVRSFTKDDQGVREAETLFAVVARENEFDEAEIETGLENGWMEKGDYQLFISHSN